MNHLHGKEAIYGSTLSTVLTYLLKGFFLVLEEERSEWGSTKRSRVLLNPRTARKGSLVSTLIIAQWPSIADR